MQVRGSRGESNEERNPNLVCSYSNLFTKVSFPTSSVYHFLPTHKTLGIAHQDGRDN